MTRRASIVERAFELARSGTCRSVTDVRMKLKAERYDFVDNHLAGKSIVRQLQSAMKTARLGDD